MKRFKKLGKISILLIICLALLNFGASCRKGGDKEALEAFKPIRLVYWSVWNDSYDLSEVISSYKAMHPNITIEFHKIPFEDYETELIDALAEDRGPDIFSIHNTWTAEYQNKILPLPPTTTLAYKFLKGTIKKEEVVQLVTKKSLIAPDIKKKFVDVVEKDVVLNNQIYGLPMSLDTMVLYYNQDILDNKGVPLPPTSWQQFEEHVHHIKEVDEDGKIVLAGAGIGSGQNVTRSFDLLSVLMMQNLTTMASDGGKVIFDLIPEVLKGKVKIAPGVSALEFYTKFADEFYDYYYTWGQQMPNSLDAFINGQSAYFFGYAYHLPTIYNQAQKLNFGIAPLPQIEGNPKVNYANYWVETVSKKTENQDAAWDFVQYITNKDNVMQYLTKKQKPTALRALINDQLNDPTMGVFVEQVLTAKSWYHGLNPASAEKIFVEMIDDVVAGKSTSSEAIKNTVKKIQQIWSGKAK